MMNFEEMGFTPGILKAVQELGFEQPMPVQERVIPLMLGEDRDIIALAQTGTGKTAAFGLPLVQMTDTELNATQALILCPTRELCMQITGDLTDYARYTGKLRILAVYGGASIDNQIRELKKGVHIIVATPGRLIDLIGRKAARLSAVTTVILDEADEMLNMGFLDSINEILEEVPAGRRTLLFSATMSTEIAGIAKRYMSDPNEITIGTKNASAENVTHGYYLVHAKDKYKVLKRIADSEPDIYGIVFCRTRKETQEIASKLIEDGYNADALHGDLSQAQRDTVMQKFRVRNLQLLIATDVAARGLDVDDLTHIINYNLPDDNEVYTHRSGRTGRAGKKGISISLINVRDRHNLKQIERIVKKPFKAIQIPSGSEICGKQLFHWIKKLETVVTEHQEIEKFLPEITEKLSGLDREELLRRVVSLQFDRFLDDYRSGEEIISPLDRDDNFKGSDRKGARKEYSGNYKRLFINLGKTDGFYPEQLIELVNKNTQGKKVPLGKIDLLKTFSFFEVEAEFADYLIEALNNSKFNDRRVAVEIAQEKPEGFRESDRSEKRHAKWSDRKPDRKRDGRKKDSVKPLRWEKKSGKKDKKKKSW
ncbi:MAG: ATP-dependent RNA helicase [Bacteroidetes bacterium GWE2_41_25]|nr:MAG: ATP-dependent RNA helicase [Bacteroidetes bacterium GWA2_40_15]OFX98270.1 MAG: ATP-dependent RNA helicase [Bacteroidetes bacterium GWC2_40_22]OFY11238.1 MAG: ATP-dependent RNA helicase [Bacteroidetes bacterium GWE2_41_25]OFY57063.1 MAG: ATP-dependent RNA helicase [Bacteroidetes bacterium GWF2_41_9]HBH85053.1 ATP-dependent RNA helicase [Bacteroidales bacterium]